MEGRTHLLLLFATLLVAGSFIVSGELAGTVHPFSLTLLRFAGASLVLLPIVLFKEKWRAQILGTLPRAMVISLFYSGFFVALFESLNTTTSLNTGALFTLVPFFTALLSTVVFKESLSRRQVLAYLCGAAGSCWVVFGGNLDLLLSFALNRGDLIFLLGIVSMCFYSIAMKYLYQDDEMIVLVFCTLLGGSFWITLALISIAQPLQWNLIQDDSVLQMLYLILCATLTTVYINQKATVILGPGRAKAYIYLTPAFVALISFLVYDVAIPPAIL
ncbi:MAG: DMT family transporter, partial [Candidatus Lindowbacteria bacterium]|nr:DMT family transporter [Candidatus Lindowbacteria bacterium]